MEVNKKILIIEDMYLAKEKLRKDITKYLFKEGLDDVKLIFKDSITDLKSETAAILKGDYSLVFMDGDINGGKTTEIVQYLMQQKVATPLVSISGSPVLKGLGLYNLGISYNQSTLSYTLKAIIDPDSEIRIKRKELIDGNTGHQEETSKDNKPRRKRISK